MKAKEIDRAIAKPVYPIIFVHGLIGSDESFATTMQYLNNTSYNWGSINVFDAVLEADDNNESSLLYNDVKWQDFTFSGRSIRLGRRNFAANVDNYVFSWDSNSRIFAINFKEERIKGAGGGWFGDDYFDYSDQAAIYKQGYALGKMISEVLTFTQAEKVILVGHSMGGLAIREYLQRTNDGTTYSGHRWWINPSDNQNGHKVARVTTIGTPHLGSNAGFDPKESDPTKSGPLPNEKSAALRDLKYSYSKENAGVYLFGGYESNLSTAFWSRDVDCDGNSYSFITGISSNTTYNPNMPLPENIKYTWIVSDGGVFTNNGDDCVMTDRQWLYNYYGTPAPISLTDTLMTHRVHWHEGEDYKSIIRGLDEPEQKELAYKIKFDKSYSGSITQQTNRGTLDKDLYCMENITAQTKMRTTISGYSSGVNRLRIFDANDRTYLDKSFSFTSNDYSIEYNVGITDRLYLEISGTATSANWQYPYSFKTIVAGTNNQPVVANQFGDKDYYAGFDRDSINLSNHFLDPDNDELTFSIINSNVWTPGSCDSNFVNYYIKDNFLILTGSNGNIGAAEIEIKADDGFIRERVGDCTSKLRVRVMPIKAINEDFGTININLNDHFYVAGASPIKYMSVLSCDTNIVNYSLSDSVLILSSINNQFGLATITIKTENSSGIKAKGTRLETDILPVYIRVNPVNDSLKILSFNPADSVQIPVKASQRFAVMIDDVDHDFNNLQFTWKVDSLAQQINDSAFTCTFNTEGNFLVKCVVNDGDYIDSMVWKVSVIQGSAISESSIPKVLELQQNYPNPFNPLTSINFSLPAESDIKIKLYNVLGKELDLLVNKRFTAGYHNVNFDGSRYSSGVFYYVLYANDRVIGQKKMLLIK